MFCAICGKRVGRTVGPVSRGAIPRVRCINGRNCHNSSADFKLVERESIKALRSWLEGYKVKIDTVGFADDIAESKGVLQKLDEEAEKISAQMENAYNLVEQGIYTLDLFKERRKKLNDALDAIKQKRQIIELKIARMEESDDAHSNLIPQTEALLDSYESMSNQERNDMLKTILYKMEYRREAGGEIEIDLYPRLPQL